jgi:hypothetical protein
MKDNYTKEEWIGLMHEIVNDAICSPSKVTKKHSNGCAEFVNEWIKNRLEEPFKEGWYIYKTNPKFLVYTSKHDDGIFWGYGFGRNGDWFINSSVSLSGCRPATKEEVEKALIEEAERRGFKEGTTMVGWDINKTHNTIKGASYTYYKEQTVDSDDDETFFTENSLWLGNTMLFDNGTWAEIVEEEKEDYMDINGEYDKDRVEAEWKMFCGHMKRWKDMKRKVWA